MTKLGLIIKQESERCLKDRLQDAESLLVVKYSGISASDLSQLRNSLSNVDSNLMVFKNCVSRRIFKSNKELCQFIEGPSGLIFINKDLISTSKIVYDFIKQSPSIEICAGILKDKVLSAKEIEVIAKIPSLSALHSQVVGGLKSPIFGFLFSLKQIINKLAWALERIKDKKNQPTATPA